MLDFLVAFNGYPGQYDGRGCGRWRPTPAVLTGDVKKHMTNEGLRQQLEREKERLLKELDQLKTANAPVGESREGSSFGKKEEAASETVEREKSMVLEAQLKTTLAEVEDALGKFKTEKYGACELCGRPIERARLEAIPHARLCLECKSKQSKTWRR